MKLPGTEIKAQGMARIPSPVPMYKFLRLDGFLAMTTNAA